MLIEIDTRFSLLLCIFHGLPCAAALVLDTKHNQIRSVHHVPVSGLVGILIVAPGSSFAHFDFVVVIPEGLFIISELCSEIGQHPNMGAVVAAVFPLAAAYCGGSKLIKLSIPANQELLVWYCRDFAERLHYPYPGELTMMNLSKWITEKKN